MKMQMNLQIQTFALTGPLIKQFIQEKAKPR